MARVSIGTRFALALAALALVFGVLTFLAINATVQTAITNTRVGDAVRQAVILYVGVNTLMLLLFAVLMFNRTIARPLQALAQRADTASPDAAPFDLPGGPRDEVGDLSASLARMTGRLREDRDRIAGHLRDLESKTRALEAAQRQLVRAEKLALVGRLAAGIAHEIGSPLGAVLGYLDMLRHDIRDQGSTANVEFLDRMEKEINRINRIVRELLDYSRPASFKVEPLDLARSVTDVVALLQPQKPFREVAFAVDLGAGPIRVQSDGDRLRQVLMNLFFNASDSMNGKGRITVTAAQGPGDGEVSLTVVDTGCGMDKDELEKIFEPFYTTKVPGAGTGLGLAVSQRLIESMGGRITVQSEPGRGSTFTVILKAGDAALLSKHGTAQDKTERS